MNLVHSCLALLFLFIELVVEVVSCTLLGLSQVSGKVVDAVAQCLLFLMQSSLCTEEVVLGNVVIRVLISCSMKSGLVEVVSLSIISSKCVSGIKRRTIPNVR